MALFRKSPASDDPPAATPPPVKGPELGGVKPADRAILEAMLADGADLEKPRHVLFYLYFPREAGAKFAKTVLRGRGHDVTVTEPSEDSAEWAVVAESRNRGLLPDFLRLAVDVCEQLVASRGGTYDGWRAGPTEAEIAEREARDARH